MNVYEAILKRRTIRKFTQQTIDRDILKKLVNAARVAPQGANLQPLKYIIIDEQTLLPAIFETTKWAGYLYPHATPEAEERPVAYIVILNDLNIKKAGWEIDAGAAIENLILAAMQEEIGTCWLGAIDRNKIKEILNIPNQYHVESMVALGYPKEQPVMEERNENIKYYKDNQGILHVPKRTFDEVVFYNKGVEQR